MSRGLPRVWPFIRRAREQQIRADALQAPTLHPALPYPVYPYTLRGFLISVGRCRVREPRTISNYNVAHCVPASRRLRVFSTSLSVYLPRKQFYSCLRGTVVRGVVQAPALAVSRF